MFSVNVSKTFMHEWEFSKLKKITHLLLYFCKISRHVDFYWFFFHFYQDRWDCQFSSYSTVHMTTWNIASWNVRLQEFFTIPFYVRLMQPPPFMYSYLPNPTNYLQAFYLCDSIIHNIIEVAKLEKNFQKHWWVLY